MSTDGNYKQWLHKLFLAAAVGIICIAIVGLFAAIEPRYTALSTVVAVENPEIYTGQPTPAMAAALEEMGWSVHIWAIYFTTLETLLGLSGTLVAIFIIWKKPTYWFAIFMALGLATGNTGAVYNLYALQDAYPEWRLIVLILSIIGSVGYIGSLLLFPNGRFVPKWAGILGAIWIPFVVIAYLFIPEFYPPRVVDGIDTGREIFFIVFTFGWLITGSICQFYRYFWHSTQLEKQQTKWVVLSLCFFFFMLIPLIIGAIVSPGFVLAPSDSVSGVSLQIIYIGTFYLGGTFIPIAMASAILRYRLWDIDIIINRTLVYGILSVLIFGVYVFLVSGLGTMIASSNVQIFSLLATGIVVISFHSLHERIQRAVNRLMFGQRDEPQKVLTNLSHQLQSAIMPEDLLSVSAITISQSLHVPYVAIAIQYGDGIIKQAEHGTNGMPTQSFPLLHQNEAVGELIIGQRSPKEVLNDADHAILSTIAQQLGAVAYAVRLQSDLQIARERLVIAREEERRRIRRDLHDGLGPALASQPLKIDSVIDLVMVDKGKAIELLASIKKQSQVLVTDIRRLVHDLRPPALDELGLIESLRNSLSQMNSSKQNLTIHFHVKTDLPPLSAAVEVAAYRIVMEAVTNVIKHASASNCHISFELLEHQSYLRITISDDGIGLGAVLTSGLGLQSMRERCEELGGTFTIEANMPQGTQVLAVLPLSRREAE